MLTIVEKGVAKVSSFHFSQHTVDEVQNLVNELDLSCNIICIQNFKPIKISTKRFLSSIRSKFHEKALDILATSVAESPLEVTPVNFLQYPTLFTGITALLLDSKTPKREVFFVASCYVPNEKKIMNVIETYKTCRTQTRITYFFVCGHFGLSLNSIKQKLTIELNGDSSIPSEKKKAEAMKQAVWVRTGLSQVSIFFYISSVDADTLNPALGCLVRRRVVGTGSFHHPILLTLRKTTVVENDGRLLCFVIITQIAEDITYEFSLSLLDDSTVYKPSIIRCCLASTAGKRRGLSFAKSTGEFLEQIQSRLSGCLEGRVFSATKEKTIRKILSYTNRSFSSSSHVGSIRVSSIIGAEAIQETNFLLCGKI
eukprot:snap_masked-scaffold_1-processed-gene-21.39-mRNA-1 protein AED:1.00 eAED:1.00 QI:0/0/0/0/1/1/2/0/368